MEAKEQLQLRQLRSSLNLRSSIEGLKRQIHEMDSEIDRLRPPGPAGSSEDSPATAGGHVVELLEVQSRRQVAVERLSELQRRRDADGAAVLDDCLQHEIRQIEEQLDAQLPAHLRRRVTPLLAGFSRSSSRRDSQVPAGACT